MEVSPARRRLVLELSVTAAVLLWRLRAVPLRMIWQDAAAVLAVYWLYCAARDSARPRPLAASVVAAYLVGVYLSGQVPHLLRALGWG